MPFRVEKVRPMAEPRQGSNVFIVEGVVPNPEGWLRPGMEGAATIYVDHRNAAWVLTRNLVSWLRLKMWW